MLLVFTKETFKKGITPRFSFSTGFEFEYYESSNLSDVTQGFFSRYPLNLFCLDKFLISSKTGCQFPRFPLPSPNFLIIFPATPLYHLHTSQFTLHPPPPPPLSKALKQTTQMPIAKLQIKEPHMRYCIAFHKLRLDHGAIIKSLVFICQENPRQSGISLFRDNARLYQLMKNGDRRHSPSSGMAADKLGKLGVFYFHNLSPISAMVNDHS